MQYSEKVLDHFTHPRNVGEIEDANGVGEVGNAKCGDIMKIYLKVSDDGIIEDVKFKTFGCGAAIATSSMATEMVKGKSLEEALKLTNKAVAEALDGLPPVKMHCSVLAEEALRSAISDYYKRMGKDPAEILGCDADCAACHKDGYSLRNNSYSSGQIEKSALLVSCSKNFRHRHICNLNAEVYRRAGCPHPAAVNPCRPFKTAG